MRRRGDSSPICLYRVTLRALIGEDISRRLLFLLGSLLSLPSCYGLSNKGRVQGRQRHGSPPPAMGIGMRSVFPSSLS